MRKKLFVSSALLAMALCGPAYAGMDEAKAFLDKEINGLSAVTREVVEAEDIVDYTQKDSVAEKLARRFGAAVGTAVMETAARWGMTIR